MKVWGRLALAAVLAGWPAGAQEVFDLILKGGRVVDPKNGRDGRMDIGIRKGRIGKIAASIPAVQGRKVVDVGDYIVTPGLIDLNANFDIRRGSKGVNPDHNELRACVTTAVEGGNVDAAAFAEFKTKVIDDVKTRVLVFLAAEGNGEAAAAVARQHPEVVVGFRAGANGAESAVRAAELTKTVVLGEGPGLRAGDIQTGFYRSGSRPAAAKGVVLDLGHGAAGFWFRVAAPAVKQGRLPDTLSTGLDAESVMLPRATMTNVMTKMLALGAPLNGLIARATVNPARALRRPELGSLTEGGVADVAVLETRAGSFGLLDAGHARLTATREVRCVMTVRAGAVVWDSEGLSVRHWMDAGPYSNFK